MRKWEDQMKATVPGVTHLIGPQTHLDNEVKVIGRWIRATEQGIELEVDSRYVQQAIEAYGLQEAKEVATPAVKEETLDGEARRDILVKRLLGESRGMTEKDSQEERQVRGEPLEEQERKKFQSVSALLNFVVPDCPDLLFAIKEVLRATAAPGADDLRRLKRILRYLRGRPRRILEMPWTSERAGIEVCVDSDFAGCRVTRKSTCGGCVLWGDVLVKAWSKTMATLALSTGEAELGATTRGAAEAEGIAPILRDFGISDSIRLKSDASAAIGITQRMGLGKVRHLSVADLWIQQKVRRQEVEIEKLPGEHNPSDLMTKAMDGERIKYLLGLMGVRLGRPSGASTGQGELRH